MRAMQKLQSQRTREGANNSQSPSRFRTAAKAASATHALKSATLQSFGGGGSGLAATFERSPNRSGTSGMGGSHPGSPTKGHGGSIDGGSYGGGSPKGGSAGGGSGDEGEDGDYLPTNHPRFRQEYSAWKSSLDQLDPLVGQKINDVQILDPILMRVFQISVRDLLGAKSKLAYVEAMKQEQTRSYMQEICITREITRQNTLTLQAALAQQGKDGEGAGGNLRERDPGVC